MDSTPDTAAFIDRWSKSGAAERANYQLFLSELCDLLGVARPDPTTPEDGENAYVFERNVTFHHPNGSTSTGRIDLYKRACFVLEAKQGVEKREQAEALADATKARAKAAKRGTAQRGSAAWDEAMLKARGQAEQYARALPAGEGRPPLLIIVDVGHSIELYSEFTRTGGIYVPFPDPQSHRILLAKLSDLAVRETLRLAWTDPQALDPARRSARVTRKIAQSLGLLAASLEKSGHGAEAVATFLMRALFTMFAEDMELLPKDSFLKLLTSLHGHTEQFVPMVEELWGRMKTGGFSTVLREKIRHFNGGLFEHATALPLTDDQFDLLIEASRADWCDVEPAIFGTLLERALNPVERHKLGAHYTPRAYVERLVMPTVVEPLRAEWDAAKAAAITLDRQGNPKEAVAEVQRFHRRLCELRVLDPACGSGNFLYVTLEHLKRLEGEVLNALESLGHEQGALELSGFTVDPHQLLGIEVNPRAAAIAELVLWIGYLQWHFRTRGHVAPPEPIIKAFHNIECRDAVLAWDGTEPVLDETGAPLTRWDGRTLKTHPVTGEAVPDETARVPVVRYLHPRKAEWPAADFIVGNPPFIGPARMRDALGDGYTEALRKTHAEVSESSDFVMYWWNQAAHQLRAGAVGRFGFITTNSIRQTFNRRVMETHLAAKDPVSLAFAIPDHPWVDAADGAAVRIAMTVARPEPGEGVLKTVTAETTRESGENDVELTERHGIIHADLTAGANVAASVSLRANENLSNHGVITGGEGFIITQAQAVEFGLGKEKPLNEILKPILNGKDLTAHSRGGIVIDLFGLTAEQVRESFPQVYQWVLTRVKPVRDQNNRESRRLNWWLFNENVPKLRNMLKGLRRFISTVETSKHRFFVFLDEAILPAHKLVNIAIDDAYSLGVLSSRIHVTWALAAGSTLEDRPVYVKTTCFETFPFPAATEPQRARIRELGEALDAHRKRQQALHPKLTLTDCYNVLEKLRAGEPLSPKERATHEAGLVSVLRQLHDDLDAAVADAYGFPPGLSDQETLARLVALNAQRAAEESRGEIRWLRPEFQCAAATPVQTLLDTGEDSPAPDDETDGNGKNGRNENDGSARPRPSHHSHSSHSSHSAGPAARAAKDRLPWPKTIAEQVQAVRAALATHGAPADAPALAARFAGARADRLDDLLETLASLGQARALPDGTYTL